MATSRKRPLLVRAITENFFWKVISLAASIGLWLAFAGETEISTSVPVTVRYRGVPPDLEISTGRLDRLFLKVRGPGARLTGDSLSHTALVLDFADVHNAGERTFTIGAENLNLPAGISLVRVVPSQIRVLVERKTSREVTVQPQFSGMDPGYRITRQQVTPAQVMITGPESNLKKIQMAYTDPIDLGSTVGNQQFQVPAYLADPQVQFMGEPPKVLVRVTLEKIP